MKLRTTWTTLLLMMALTGLSARAEVGDGPIAALPWLHERLQLTYTWQATVVPGTEHDFEEVTDPHGQAHWVSKSTGAPLERTVRQGTSGS